MAAADSSTGSWGAVVVAAADNLEASEPDSHSGLGAFADSLVAGTDEAWCY